MENPLDGWLDLLMFTLHDPTMARKRDLVKIADARDENKQLAAGNKLIDHYRVEKNEIRATQSVPPPRPRPRLQVRSVVLPVIKKLSTGEPCLIPHVGAHPCPWKNVSPQTAGVSGASAGKKEADESERKRGREWKGREEWRARARPRAAAPIENHARCARFFFHYFFSLPRYMWSAFVPRAHCRFLNSKDFPVFSPLGLFKPLSHEARARAKVAPRRGGRNYFFLILFCLSKCLFYFGTVSQGVSYVRAACPAVSWGRPASVDTRSTFLRDYRNLL